MIAVLEGLDRTGKSTLARELQELLPQARVIHSAKPQHHPLDEYLRPIQDGSHVIFDRAHIGELVWPRIFKRDSIYDEHMHRYIEMVYRARGGVVVHCVRDLVDLRYACLQDNEPVKGVNIEIANALFEDALDRLTSNPVVRYEQGTSSAADIATTISHAGGDVTTARAVSRFWIGSPYPRTLLVGDIIGPGTPDWVLPFVPYRNTSGHYLMQALSKSLLLNWRNIAIVNSRRPAGGEENLNRLWFDMGFPNVVALGRKAEAVLQAQDVPHRLVPHPQYARRFLRRIGPVGYARTIERVAR